jgi:lipoprotein-releasing system ATP-binding protein
MSDAPLYELKGVGKDFVGPGETVSVLRHVDFRIDAGESVAVLGASGSGKSTLLHIMGTLDEAGKGEVLFQGTDLMRLSDSRKKKLRNKEMGFVFQFHHLLPEFNTLENVAMPGLISGMKRKEALGLARETLELAQMGHRMEHSVTTLSGGERQRAAIARAVVLRPKVLLADEPTGNLDEKTGEGVAAFLARLNEELGMTLIVVTHNAELADMMQRRLEIRAGEVHEVAAG